MLGRIAPTHPVPEALDGVAESSGAYLPEAIALREVFDGDDCVVTHREKKLLGC